MDMNGLEKISFKDLLMSIAILQCKDLQQGLKTVFDLYDYEKKELLEYSEFLRIFKNLSMLLDNFGDKGLHDTQLQDLVDSIFTMNGKIDGCICYSDYIVSIVNHPIVQISLCMQFQGSGREKLKGLLFSES